MSGRTIGEVGPLVDEADLLSRASDKTTETPCAEIASLRLWRAARERRRRQFGRMPPEHLLDRGPAPVQNGHVPAQLHLQPLRHLKFHIIKIFYFS